MHPVEQLRYLLTQSILTIVLACVLFVLLFWRKLLEKYYYPPGPIPLPIIGNAYFLLAKSRGIFKYKNWSKYGNVISYVTFSGWNVDLYGFDAIQECLVKNSEHFSERSPSSAIFSKLTHPGLLFGNRWRDLRRLALVVMREHGMGKVKIEDKIREELEYNVEVMSALVGRQSSENFKETIGKALSNVIAQVAFGHRLDYKDDNLTALCSLDPAFTAMAKSAAVPLYKYLPWDPFQMRVHSKTIAKVSSFISSEIEQHKATLDVNQPKDLIDTYLVEGTKSTDPLYADQGNRAVNMADRKEMHFTCAFIQEVLRAGCVATQSLSHLCTKDTVIQGQKIPAGTAVWANIYSTHQNEEVYSDSQSFIPERFLDDKGMFVKPSGKQMLPFGIGKRVCLGESLARTEMFMILVSFVQKFEVSRVSEEKLSAETINGLTNAPRPFEFNLKERC